MRVALVTGGSRGIGAAIVARLAADGWHVIAVARGLPDVTEDRSRSGLAQNGPIRGSFPPVGNGSVQGQPGHLAPPESGSVHGQPIQQALPQSESVRETQFQSAFLQCDVADAGQVAALFAHIRQRYGRLDALITAAGIAGPNALDGDDATWHAIIGSNLHGTYHCCKAALPLLPDHTGRIVTIASVLGLRGVPDQTAYCAAKHGVVGFTRALALAVAPRGITVNAICPGWTDTEMARSRFTDLGITGEDAAAQMPTGRMVSPDEVADTVAWLLRPETRSLTGHALPLDGGGLALP